MFSIVRKLTLVAVFATAPALVGCGPKAQAARVANVQEGAMPDGGTWDGVYFSPLFGNLHIVTAGGLVQGRWLRPLKGEWGKLQGNASGNVLRFDWEEYKDGLVGPNSKRSGKGYFVYTRPEGDNVDDALKGEMGRGQDELGTEWVAMKQRNVKPDINSIGGAGSTDVGGGDWDKGNREGGEPEAPASPSE
jgi:hypothetical protein